MDKHTQAKSEVHVRVASPDASSDDHGEDQERVKFKSSIPSIGLIAVIYAAGSVLITFGILKAISHERQWGTQLIKPASVLSVILSTTSIALHVAMEAGLNVYWWRRANRSGVTVGELHSLWSEGTSLFEAAKSGLRFKLSYMAMTTLFIASIPINGLLLQSAVSAKPDTTPFNNTAIKIPMSTRWANGYSASYNAISDTNASLGMLNEYFASDVSTWQNLDALQSPWSIYVSDYDVSDGRQSNSTASLIGDSSKNFPQATFRARGVGLKATCQNQSETFNFMPDPLGNTQNYDPQVLFQANTSWDPIQDPNVFHLYIKMKSNQPHYLAGPFPPDPTTGDPSPLDRYTYCMGDYSIVQCTFEVYETEYSLMLSPEEGFADDLKEDYTPYWYLSLHNETHWQDDVYISRINSTSTSSMSNTTYGGISAAMEMFHGQINFQQMPGGKFQTSQSSPLALAVVPLPANDEYVYGTSDVCNTTFVYGDAWEVLNSVQDSLRALMFISSHTNSFDSESGVSQVQNVTGSVIHLVNVYQINWRYYFASLAVTLVIVGVIVPSFNGFWKLPRKTTLSPFETARAFKSPITSEISAAEPVKHMVRDLGHTRVHRGDSVV